MTAHVRMSVEHHTEPLGIGEATPRLSWVTTTRSSGWAQSAYEIESTSEEGTETTGRVSSTDQVLVDWPFKLLQSRQSRSLRVRVWDGDGEVSAWSEPVVLETGLLDPSLWEVDMVSPVLSPQGEGGEPAALLRGTVEIPNNILAARLRATAHGVMTMKLNGEPVGEDVLHPGWTTYAKRLRYRTWDVTELVRPGKNVLGVHLADGWFRGYLGFHGKRATYGDTTATLVQLEITLSDGSTQILGTDRTWRSTMGPVTRADLYKGETYDARREIPKWSELDFDDSGWDPVMVVEYDPATLVAPTGPAVRRTQTVNVQEVITTPGQKTLLDFGQNLVGRLRVQVPAMPPGTAITLRHAEVLENVELGTRPLRLADATDVLISAGMPFIYEPDFTFHGFRFVEVSGWPGPVDPDSFTAVVTHTDMTRTGYFEASDPDLTRLHENVLWSMRGNFLDIPTDCPQRDERLGWTGDLTVFAPTAAYLYDTAGMLTGWLADLAEDQDDDGTVPLFVPWVVPENLPPADAEAGWGDAATVVPWTLFERYGDAF